MRAIDTFALLPALCSLAMLQACSTSNTGGDDSNSTGAVAGSTTTSRAGAPAGVSGAPGSSGAFGVSGAFGSSGDTSSAGDGFGGSGNASSGGAGSGGTLNAGGDSAAGAGGKKGGNRGGAGGNTSSGGGGGMVNSGGASGAAGSTGTGGMTSLGQFVMTWYSFQDNTPVNSSQSASGKVLHAYVSVAMPFRFITGCGDPANKPPKGVTSCGPLNFGDKLYIDYLNGKKMPNGMVHNGWVELDDYCGDGGSDGYCFQKLNGKSYPNTDLYIGDFSKSGMAASSGNCSGPAGSGQELMNLSKGDPGSAFVTNWGGADLGSGKCGDYATAEMQQGGLKGGCWDYTPPANNFCSSCVTGVSCN